MAGVGRIGGAVAGGYGAENPWAVSEFQGHRPIGATLAFMRVRKSASEKRALSAFYGDLCVLSDKWRAEAHHNDENSGRTVFENLLPLCATCNGPH